MGPLKFRKELPLIGNSSHEGGLVRSELFGGFSDSRVSVLETLTEVEIRRAEKIIATRILLQEYDDKVPTGIFQCIILDPEKSTEIGRTLFSGGISLYILSLNPASP